MTTAPLDIIKACANDLALTAGELLSIASTAPSRYYVWRIAKRSGIGTRTVCHPARELKNVQYYFLDEVLNGLPVHPSASAYVSGSSIKKNAEHHVKSRVIMKLDFVNFFNSLTVSNWKSYALKHFPNWSAAEVDFSCRILFWGAGTREPVCLAIGSPTSPLVSNALMYEVDARLNNYANRAGLLYTRYADDITFSSEGYLGYAATVAKVKRVLRGAEYSSVRLNDGKTVLASKKMARRVTGLVITPDNKVSIGRDRKRLIRAMVNRARYGMLAAEDLPRLAGFLAFAADVEPEFVGMLRARYSGELISRLLRQED